MHSSCPTHSLKSSIYDMFSVCVCFFLNVFAFVCLFVCLFDHSIYVKTTTERGQTSSRHKVSVSLCPSFASGIFFQFLFFSVLFTRREGDKDQKSRPLAQWIVLFVPFFDLRKWRVPHSLTEKRNSVTSVFLSFLGGGRTMNFFFRAF